MLFIFKCRKNWKFIENGEIMMQIDLFEFIIDVYRHNGVNVLLLKEEKEWSETDLKAIDFGLRKKMSAGFNYRLLGQKLDTVLHPGICYLIEDDLGMWYSFFRFSEQQAKEFSCRILCLGPVLFRSFAPEDFEKLMEHKKIAPDYRQDFIEFFNHVPVFSSYDNWNHTLGFFLEKLCSKPPVFSMYDQESEENFGFLPFSSDYSSPTDPNVALTIIENRYRTENELLKAVAAGNAADACRAYFQFLQYRLLPRVSNPVRNQKNLLFILNTLLRKAAEAGHVHPFYLDSLSRQFAIQIESCLTVGQLERLSTTMIRKYCIMVINYSRRDYSPLIHTCMDYIDFHYSSELSLSSLAKICSVSSSYLSSLFKKETGMTITDYINKTRIRQSLILLNASGLSVSEIASRCGFFDTNYFSRIFKKFQGQSPRQYRDSIRKPKS